jgi:hypothetical protein
MFETALFAYQGVAPMGWQLVVLAGPDKGRTFPLRVGPDRVLGRSALLAAKLPVA